MTEFSLPCIFAGEMEMKENVCYGPVSNTAQPAQAHDYEEPVAKPKIEIQIGKNVTYRHCTMTMTCSL